MKKATIVSAWARGFDLALMLVSCGTTVAQGAIVFITPQPAPYYSLGYPGTLDFNIDINGDGATDFVLRSNDPSSGVNNAVLIPQGNNAIVNMSSSVANMNPGDTVGSSLNPVYYWSIVKTPISVAAALPDPPYGVELGNFVGQSSGYVGFDLLENATHHYGWLRITSPINDAVIYGDVVSWAYESDANMSIGVGAVPEPSTLCLGILGLCLYAYQKRICK